MTKTKVGKEKVDAGSFRQTLTPIEDEFALVTMLKIALNGFDIGAYVLKRKERDYKIQFGFACSGIHTTLRDEEIDPVFDAIKAGLKDFPESETLSVHLGSFTEEGKWKVNLIANLMVFKEDNKLGKIIPFNKEIFLRAVEAPEYLQKSNNKIAEIITRVRQSGLEIYGIREFKLEDLKR